MTFDQLIYDEVRVEGTRVRRTCSSSGHRTGVRAPGGRDRAGADEPSAERRLVLEEES